MRRAVRITAITLASIIGVVAISAYGFLQHPQFGESPNAATMQRIEASPNYADGQFRNLEETPIFTGDPEEQSNFLVALIQHFSNRPADLSPQNEIPSVRTDLHALDPDEDLIIWFGHSSFFVQLGGYRILIDPVFSLDAAPIPWVNRAYDGTNVYSVDDFPDVDYVLISHDHWDHLDYPSVRDLQPKTRHIVAGLGLGANFKRWGYTAEQVIEADWFDNVEHDDGLSIHVTPTRHYSSRMLERNQTLWVGYVIETDDRRIYISGDSGYGEHLQQIAERFERFDLVAPEFGQYDENWAHIHKTPEEAARAAIDLNADSLIFNHIGKFTLANHPWDEPFQRIVQASEGADYDLLTPMIGEPVYFDRGEQSFTSWWEDVD